MAGRYTADELVKLRESPLIAKPPDLPSAEQWMGASPETRKENRPTGDRLRHDATSMLDHTNRRPGLERHMSRSSANPEDIILGPPRISFKSATSTRNLNKSTDLSDHIAPRDKDSKETFALRSKGGDGETDRFKDKPTNLRSKRVEGDQDNDGWSTVKARKSFGTEGAERFNGRMGGDRHRDDRRFKDREERGEMERPQRRFSHYSRDKEGDHDHDPPRKNGAGRSRGEPSWFKEDPQPATKERLSNGDRFHDRSRGWREKEDRGDRNDRGDRRWERDRDNCQDRDPEWMDEPLEGKSQAHTQEDFQKWKKQMQGRDNAGIKTESRTTLAKSESNGQASFLASEEKPKFEAPIPIDTGPDKFFGMWSKPKHEGGPEDGVAIQSDGPGKAKPGGKASRFTSFFAPQETLPRRQTDPPAAASSSAPNNDANDTSKGSKVQSQSEKEAFQTLLDKLHRQHEAGSNSTPPANASFQKSPPLERLNGAILNNTQQYRPDRQDDGRSPSFRNTQPPGLQDLLNQRQAVTSQPQVRPDQILNDFVVQRQNTPNQSSTRPEKPEHRSSNTDFLMGLMQSAKTGSESQRSEQHVLRNVASSQQQMHQQQLLEQREQDIKREAARRDANMPSRPPLGFFDEPQSRSGPPPSYEALNTKTRNGPRLPQSQQPTQVLQRPPPGLEPLAPNWAQAPPPPQISITQQQQQMRNGPPPGLSQRAGMSPPPPQLLPLGFPTGNFIPPPPPESMSVNIRPGPRMQPPPGFFPPPPGFLPPGVGFDGLGGFGFDSRAMGQQHQRGSGQGGFR